MRRDPNCTGCKLHKTCKTVCVLGTGPLDAEVMIVGEAPGKHEDEGGKPFIGAAGRLLTSALERAGIARDECYVTNAVNCRPPENRTPTKAEIRACKKWLDYQIAMIKPKYVLLLGNVPLLAALGTTGIKKARGKPVERDGIIYLPTYHPAFLLRDPTHMPQFDRDLAMMQDIIEFGGIPYEKAVDYEIVDSEASVQRLLAALTGTVSYDVETTGLYPWVGKIVSIGFGTKDKQFILPVTAEAWSVPWSRKRIIEIMDRCAERMADCIVVGHHFKFDALWTWVDLGIELACDFDTMLAHYLLDENDRHGLDHLASLFLGARDWDVPLELKQGKAGKFEDHAMYLASDVYYTRQLRFVLGARLNKDPDVKRVFDHILMPCVKLFTEAEYHGIYIDISKMKEAEDYLRTQVAEAEEALKKYGDINWASPKQVAELLFDKLGIEPLDRTAKGSPSTSESVIKRIDHPCAAALLKMRRAKQQLSFFIEGWKPFLTGSSRLHPSFKLHGTVTGRLSCEHPNLQQVPRDKRIRSLITAPPGWTLLECDLSQIELRIAAELANERNMLYAFTHGIDIHWLTAIQEIARGGGLVNEVMSTARKYIELKGGIVDYVTKNKVNVRKLNYGDAIQIMLEMGPDNAASLLEDWKELRKKAKAVNFGYLYGMWWEKFKIYARDNYGVNVTDEQAQDSRVAFFDNYPDLPDWHNRQRRFVRQYGFVSSLSGRKRRLPHAMTQANTPERREAERQAINSPVQSFANELNLMAALQIRKEYPRRVLHIVGTVHDAILFEVRNDYVERVTRRVLEVMSNPELLKVFDIRMSVPIEAEAKIGAWGTGKDLDKWLKAA